MTDRPKTTLRDCIYGLAVGDALGVPYEFRPRDTFECTDMIGYGTHGQPAGTWSDDTSMTLATCDSIRELGHIDASDMRDKFVGWIARGEYTIDGVFDYGGTTARALHTGKGGSGERDNGNGSLMRIAPLAFVDATDDEICEVSAREATYDSRTCVSAVASPKSRPGVNATCASFNARSQNVDRRMRHVHRAVEVRDGRRAPRMGTLSERCTRARNQIRRLRARHA